MELRGNRIAFGAPGLAPRWSHSNKDGVGTAYSAVSRLWFTLWRGVVTEVYYPTIDRPQLRDLELLFTNGAEFLEEKRHLEPQVERPFEHALGYRVRSHTPTPGLSIEKEIIADPHLPTLLQRIRLDVPNPEARDRLHTFVLAAPHLEVGGWGNTGEVRMQGDFPILTAQKGATALALGASVPFRRASVGYVGASDGWTDLSAHKELAFDFDLAPDGNIALTGELDLAQSREFVLALSFGRSLSAAITTLAQSLGTPYEVHRARFVEQWNRSARHLAPLRMARSDEGRLYRASHSLLLAHEDKIFPGAFIASLSIPWGASKGDEDRGGYHLVWTRDMVQTALALLAAGNLEAPLRSLVYLATRQQPDGGFAQNFWVDGEPYWTGIQLDEVAFPILLAYRLHVARGLQSFDPYPMVLRASRFLIERGPVTQEDRWEEVSGFSPATLAVSVAALSCAAEFARERNGRETATFLQEYADFLSDHIERWTVTHHGSLLPGVTTHYVRIRPAGVGDPCPDEGEEMGSILLPNQPPGERRDFPAPEVIDAGFLELVRYGVRSPDDPIIRSSLRVVDSALRVMTPRGPVWRRYNHDGYGQRDDGGPYVGYGTGRAWPLLTGERGSYEFLAGENPTPYLDALERFASGTGLLIEQVWDSPDLPAAHLAFGGSTESANPLAWAHAEYIKLVRSVELGKHVDDLPSVRERYGRKPPQPHGREFWTFGRQPRSIHAGSDLRIVAGAPFELVYTFDDWSSVRRIPSKHLSLGLDFVDLMSNELARGTVFTFFWPAADRWEGWNFSVDIVER